MLTGSSKIANIHHPVFIDKCGFNIWTARSQGRACVGEHAYRQCADKREATLPFAWRCLKKWRFMFTSMFTNCDLAKVQYQYDRLTEYVNVAIMSWSKV
jgi:hypothetical protein